jgi:hypothetical protein
MLKDGSRQIRGCIVGPYKRALPAPWVELKQSTKEFWKRLTIEPTKYQLDHEGNISPRGW